MKKVAIFDFDGTLRVPKKGSWVSPGNMKLGPAFDFFYQVYRSDYILFGLTNQGGVAHGFKTMEQVREENKEMERMLVAKIFNGPALGVSLFEKVIVAPLYPGVNCDVSHLRKPNTGALGVIEHCLSEKGITVDWRQSLMCGDRNEDKEFAERAGLKFFDAKNWK